MLRPLGHGLRKRVALTAGEPTDPAQVTPQALHERVRGMLAP